MHPPRTRAAVVCRILVMLLAVCLVPARALGSHDTHDGTSGVRLQNATLYLELVVNGVATGHMCLIQYRNGRPFARAADLMRAGVRVSAIGHDLVALDEVDDLRFAYDSHSQRLELTVPVEWLPQHLVGETGLQPRVPALTSMGVVFNYDVHASAPAGGAAFVSAWSEQRLFERWGTVSNTGMTRRTLGRNRAGSVGYLRFETRWTHTDEDRALTVTAGDLVTGALPWTSAVRLGGILLERNFKARPDIVTYPVPQFAGQAAVPTAIDLFLNGSRAVSETVPPGPFVVTSVPIVEGAGHATVVMTDVLGRETSQTVSFYVASQLLRRGLADYSMSAGVTRRGFGLTSWSYGRPAASGVARYGLTDYVTVAGHAEGGAGLASGGVGADLRLRTFGVVGAAVAHGGNAQGAGAQFAATYSYTARRYSVAVRHVQRAQAFADLTTLDLPPGVPARLARRIDQITAAASPGFLGGTLGGGYFAVVQTDGEAVRLVNVSLSRRLAFDTSAYLSVSQRLGEAGGTSAQIQVVRQIGRRGSVTASAADRGEDSPRGRVQYTRSVPPGGGFGWTAGYTPGATGHQQADLAWRTRHAQVQGGAYGERHRLTRWAGASGSLIVMGRTIAAANRVDDAFAIVETGGYPGVPVLFENQFIGRTNRRGRLLVPWVSAYYASKFSIDPLGLPSGVEVPTVEQRAAIKRRSGAVIRFPVHRTLAAIVTLVDERNRPLPVGLTATHVGTGQRAVIGWDGQTYFEGLHARNVLQVALPDGSTCSARFDMSPTEVETRRIGPLVCRVPGGATTGS